ncbi:MULTISPECIES: DUF5906 domain-containing protein [Rhodopseudomonas]|uniref:DNA primase family protein n=1 Tax=Rhodopseudomonas TaxID=1073 RepID=UPI000696FCA3|nr:MULTISPECIES: DUF5906 domain-containing protein [Rhodopseudomonas]MDF3811048.1 DUF5906 domain-containing protein [Rhodopseudomonas sp. BAL398]WOK15944.1 DUF5906 domain-containing protein [Rhodopseudomonas sp. BAL398]
MSSTYRNYEGDSEYDFDAPSWPWEIFYQGKNTPSQNAHIFLKDRPFSLICSDKDFYSLAPGGVWTLIDPDHLRAEIRRTDPSHGISSGAMRAMLDEISIANIVTARPFEWLVDFDDAPSPNDLVLARNGLINVATGGLIPLNGDYFATAVPEWDYDPDARCPLWESKLDQWLDPSFHPTLQEWFGYTLTPDTRFEKMAAFIGASRGGKGTVKGVLESLTGSNHVASIMLNDLAGDFGLQDMIDKRLLIIPDAADTDRHRRGAALERIKSITGNDRISVNRKNKAMLTSVRIPAKITILANRHPKFIDSGSAFAIRELQFLFQTSFQGVEDTALKTKLAAELPGIANWAIEGLRRLRKQNEFTIGALGKAAQADLAGAQSPELRFARECLNVTGRSTDMVPLEMAFAAYGSWVMAEGLSPNERRNREDFKNDVLASLQHRGVRYARNQVRWHDPLTPKAGEGKRIKARLVGVAMKKTAHYMPDGDDE